MHSWRSLMQSRTEFDPRSCCVAGRGIGAGIYSGILAALTAIRAAAFGVAIQVSPAQDEAAAWNLPPFPGLGFSGKTPAVRLVRR